MTPLHWSLEHMFYNHDSLPQLDFLDRQTATKSSWTLCEVPAWQGTPWHILRALLPASLCLWRTLSSRGSAMLCCCSQLHFPPKAAGAVQVPLEMQASMPRVCARAGEMSDPALGGGCSPHEQHRQPGGENHLSSLSQMKPTYGLVQWYCKWAECRCATTQQNHI